LLLGWLGSSNAKGIDLLIKATQKISENVEGVAAVVVGVSEPQIRGEFGMPTHYLGKLADDASMSLLYSAVDVLIVPSRIENLPQMATEAQSCGLPVVAFNCTGLPDAIEDGVTGFLAKAFDTDALADAAIEILRNSERASAMSVAARERALRLWAPEAILSKYMRVFDSVASGSRR
jgi:glycosyltransferase involved in cell wall biosynthesis